MAANIERGVDRANGKGIIPSIFNLGSWLWQGIQTREEFRIRWERNHEILNGNGVAYIEDMPKAFQVLGLPITYYNAYNPDEKDLVDGSFYPNPNLGRRK